MGNFAAFDRLGISRSRMSLRPVGQETVATPVTSKASQGDVE